MLLTCSHAENVLSATQIYLSLMWSDSGQRHSHSAACPSSCVLHSLRKQKDPQGPVPGSVYTGWLLLLSLEHACLPFSRSWLSERFPRPFSFIALLASRMCSYQWTVVSWPTTIMQQEVVFEIMTDFFLPGVPICLSNPHSSPSSYSGSQNLGCCLPPGRVVMGRREKTDFYIWTRLKHLRETF